MPPPPQAKTKAQIDDEIYTGSIIVVPPTGDQCWQMMIDNRTGHMWETGYVDCYAAVSELAENKRSGAISSSTHPVDQQRVPRQMSPAVCPPAH